MENQNTVKYTIICNPDRTTDLQAFCTECQSFCDEISKDYIWQKEPFLLHPITNSGLPCLCGSTDYGENISDEWFIVYLLFRLTKHCNDVMVQVCDEDGEFLLIQAADVLPRWLKPEVSENRVFIHNGAVHLIPQPSNPGEMAVYPVSTPNLGQAYQLVTGDVQTVAGESIQEMIQKKLVVYPEKIHRDFHRAHCYIPAEIVYVLRKRPDLVAKAVQAFYERDPVDVNVCSKMKVFPPSNCVVALVKFTKHLYGQLHQAKFVPHSKSCWKLPHPTHKLHKPTSLGYKLTCGFEILIARSTSYDSDTNTEPCGRKWEKYLSNLKKNDFFQGELEGSKKYTELLHNAKEHFRESFTSTTTNTDGIGHQLSQLLAEAKQHGEEVRRWCEDVDEEDSDDWLTLTPEELDEMLLNEWKQDNDNIAKASLHDTEEPPTGVENLAKMASSIKSFVEQVSDYQGAEIPGTCENGENNDEIDFDPNTFMECVKKLLHCNDNDNNSSSGFESDGGEEYDESDVDDDFVSCDGVVDNQLSRMMEMMDSELKQTNVPKSFQTASKPDDDMDAPLDLDINVIENFLESFASQDGLPGPVSTLLKNFGSNLPPDDNTL